MGGGGKEAPGKGGPPTPAKGQGKGLSYKEKQALEQQQLEEALSAPEGFSGKQPLDEQEARVLEQGATDEEPGPYAGNNFLPTRGYFVCKRCAQCLYLAQSKFVHCGTWSSFDQGCVDAVGVNLESDGRVETVCSKCQGHLGHIFEQSDGKRTKQRHCINDSAIQYLMFDPPSGVVEAGELEMPKPATSEADA
mmetsp:Transcript_95303/g.273257  ORF Transcript_95303/g.273257 Transcript_95303/m.273257 type:complete len:193 (-) Transcript_95303:215-793(-)